MGDDPLDMSTYRDTGQQPRLRTLGDLTAADLGSRVTVEDGGSTHAGKLKAAHHSSGYGNSPARTLITLVDEGWRHIKSYPADLACKVVAPSPAVGGPKEDG